MRFMSKVEQVAACLREDLLRGKWHHEMPGRDELVADLGVSVKTVERALKILATEGLLIAQGSGRRRITASSRDKTRLNISILLYDDQDHAQINSRELVLRLTAAGHNATVVEKTQTSLGMDPKRVASYVSSIPTDAWIICAGTHDILAWFSRQPFPVLAQFGQFNGLSISSVGIDKIPPIRDAVRKLIGLGHRRIVLLSRSTRRIPLMMPAERAFLDELKAHGIITGPYHMPDWSSTVDGFHRCLDSLFSTTPPTALIIDEPVHFLAAQLFLSRRRISVPGDVSMICLDPNQTFAWCNPMISHIHWEFGPIMTCVVKWADRVASGKQAVTNSVIRARFLEGGTIGPAPKV